MAQIIMRGTFAQIDLSGDPDGGVLATCIEHSESDGRLAPPGNCDWSETYFTWNDAAEYAAGHADRGDR